MFFFFLILQYYHQKHPLNYILLFIFTVTLAFAVGLTCTFTSGSISSTFSISSFELYSFVNYIICELYFIIGWEFVDKCMRKMFFVNVKMGWQKVVSLIMGCIFEMFVYEKDEKWERDKSNCTVCYLQCYFFIYIRIVGLFVYIAWPLV